jgi:hypothetical protein
MLEFAVSQETATAVIAAAAIVVSFIALAIVGWIFWRAAKRDREAELLGRQANVEEALGSATSTNGKEQS